MAVMGRAIASCTEGQNGTGIHCGNRGLDWRMSALWEGEFVQFRPYSLFLNYILINCQPQIIEE